MNFIINAFKIIFLLGFLVFIHEGGHFFAAKWFKVKVEDFSIGFGPKLLKKQGKETLYSISAIPLGGYVRMLGEEERVDNERAFNNAKIMHRIIIVAAGAVINILFAIIIYFFLSVFSAQNFSTTINYIEPQYAENLSELQVGDKIKKINDRKIRIKSDIAKALENYTSGSINVIVERNGELVGAEVIPTEYQEGIYVLGVNVTAGDMNLGERVYCSFWETSNFVGSIGTGLKMLFTGQIGVQQMTGPIGISEIVVESNGVYDFIYLLSLISLSLGITNLLPVPALDGGKIVLLIIEGIRGKALKEEVEIGIQSLGFLLLIGLSLYVSYNDILRIF